MKWESIEGVIIERSDAGKITYEPEKDGGYLAILEDYNWGSSTSMWGTDLDTLMEEAHGWFSE